MVFLPPEPPKTSTAGRRVRVLGRNSARTMPPPCLVRTTCTLAGVASTGAPSPAHADARPSRHVVVTMLRPRARLWFALAALLSIVGFVVFSATAQAMVEAAAVLTLTRVQA